VSGNFVLLPLMKFSERWSVI